MSRIKALKTPQVLKEMRVKGMLMDHKEIKASMGVKIVAPGLEMAVAGTSLYVVGPDDSEAELKHAVMQDMADIFSKVRARVSSGCCLPCALPRFNSTGNLAAAFISRIHLHPAFMAPVMLPVMQVLHAFLA